MLAKKIWIPILLILIGIAIGSTFWGKHVASQEPLKTYHPVITESADDSKSTAEDPQGHVHADGTWHAGDTHNEGGISQVGVVNPNAELRDRVLKEMESARQQGKTDAEVQAHGNAVLEAAGYPTANDAEIQEALYRKRYMQWIPKHREHTEKMELLEREWEQTFEEANALAPDLNDPLARRDFLQRVSRMTDAEKQSLAEKVMAAHKKFLAAWERLEKHREEEPVPPTSPQNSTAKE